MRSCSRGAVSLAIITRESITMSGIGESWDHVHEVVYAKSLKDSDEAYTKWAENYDEDVNKLKFVGNESMVKCSIDVIKKDESSLMLDIAAGTGKTTKCFKDAGFKGIADAIEINAAMLEVAKQKCLYRNAICQEVTATDPLPVPDNTYDFVTISGAFHGSHLPQGCIPHIVNALKVGGLLIFNSRNTDQNAEYQKVLWQILNRLVDNKKVGLVKSEVMPYYEVNSRESGKPMMSQLSIYRRLR